MDVHGGAHPRSRGENSGPRRGPPPARGSSPLTRGKQSTGRKVPRQRGLIPAHAGKTYFRCLANWLSAAHPRSRGENAATRSTASPTAGSSPLTRGKPRRRARRGRVRRLIPAHAGKTTRPINSRKRLKAHPRSRGENADDACGAGECGGSSPLTRGKHRIQGNLQDEARLIPAHAGKTSSSVGASSTAEAHPRSRGENTPPAGALVCVTGSSPLTRGKLLRLDRGGGSGRLIPAHAGKTSRRACRSRRTWAHPRSRGENEPPHT